MRPHPTHWKFFRGLQAKLVLLLVVPTALIISLQLTLFQRDLQQAILQQYLEDSLILTSIVQQQLGQFTGLPMQDIAPQVLALVLQQRPQYTFLVLHDAGGRILAISPAGMDYTSGPADTERIARVVADGKATFAIEEDDALAGQGVWLDMVAPVMMGNSGVVVLKSRRLMGEGLLLIRVIMRDVMIIGVAGVALLLAMLFLGFYLIFLRRLRRLEEASQQIANGRYEAQVVIPGRDELSTLGETFNSMARSIEDSITVEKTLNSQLTVLNATASELASSLDPGYLMDRLADGVCRLVAADGAVVYLVDPETLHIRQVATRQIEVHPDGQVGHIYEKGLFGLAAKACQGLLIEEAASHPDTPSTPGYGPLFGAIMTLPLLSGDRLLGVLVVGRTVGAKPFGLSDLDVARGLVMFGTTAIEKALLYQHSQLLASTDGLTGLYNHREFQRRLSIEFQRSQRYGHPLSLLLIDIDHFKRVNDQHGHPTGDAMLKELAETIRASIRTMDVAARYGGEEFVVILPETPSDGAVVVAERLRRQIADRRVLSVNGKSLTCSVSIGVGTYPVDAQQHDRLIDAADKALYHAKYTGRNSVKTHQTFLQADFATTPARKIASQ